MQLHQDKDCHCDTIIYNLLFLNHILNALNPPLKFASPPTDPTHLSVFELGAKSNTDLLHATFPTLPIHPMLG